MKRPANIQEPLWTDPSELKIPELRQVLTKCKIQFDLTEQRTQLFHRYVQLARIESPESVEQWIGQDSLNGPLPVASCLVMPKLKILLALHAVDFPAQGRRGELVKLYETLVNKVNQAHAPVRSVTVKVVIPPHPEHKKRKPNCRKPHAARQEGLSSLVGKTRPTRSAARSQAFFSPYDPRAPQEDKQTPGSGRTRSYQTRSSARRTDSTSQTTRSSAGRGRAYSQPRSSAGFSSHPRSTARRGRSSSEISRPSTGCTASRASSPQSAATPAGPGHLLSLIDSHLSSQDLPTPGSSARQTTGSSDYFPRQSSQFRASHEHKLASSASDSQAQKNGSPPNIEDGASEISTQGTNVPSSPSLQQPPVAKSPVDSDISSQYLQIPGSSAGQTSISSDGYHLRRSPRLSASYEREQASSASGSEAHDRGSQPRIEDDTSETSTQAPDGPSSPNLRQALVLESPVESNLSSQSSSEATLVPSTSQQVTQEEAFRSASPCQGDRESSPSDSSRSQGASGAAPAVSPIERLSPEQDTPQQPISSRHRGSHSVTRLAPYSPPLPCVKTKRKYQDPSELLDPSHLSCERPGKRRQRRQSSSVIHVRRRPTGKRSRKQTQSGQVDNGFVYMPSPSAPPITSSSASSSSYAPPITQSSRTSASLTSVSARSIRASTRAAQNERNFPTENSRQKRSKHLSEADPQTSKKESRLPRSQPKRSRRLTRPYSREGVDTFNFVPNIPDPSKKRKSPHGQNIVHSKRPRSIPCSPDRQVSKRKPRTPRQNSYSPHPALHSELEPQEYDSSNHHASGLPTPRSCRQFTAPLSSCEPAASHQTLTSLSASPWPYPSGSVHSSAAPQRKRGPPNEPSSPPVATKRQRVTQSPGRLPRIPTSAEVRRRRQRQNRVRHQSLLVRPSLHEDVYFDHHPSARGVDAWRNSLPVDLLPPHEYNNDPSLPAELLPPHEYNHDPPLSRAGPFNPTADPSHSRPGPGGGWVGERVLGEMARATGRLTDCLEGLNLAALRPGISQAQTSRPSAPHRNLTLLARVRWHIKTLFGKCMDLNQFPPPATEQERANWRRDPDDDNESMSSRASSQDGDFNPAFPYPNGPGHPEASPATLSIMWRAMQRSGVVSFCPDFTRPPRHVDNLFLWDLAHRLFILLVQAGEYSEIDLASCPEDMIRQAILNHAKQLQRIHREAGWDPKRLDQRAVIKRRQARTRTLRETRVKFLTSQAALIPLIPVINACTSDAETDMDDDDGSDVGSSNKQVIVEQLPWRHPRIGRAIETIDRLIELKRQSGCKDYGRSTIQRNRPRDPKISSTRECPKSLSCDVYCDEWLRSQRPSQLNALNIQPGPSFKGTIKLLERMI